MLMEKIGGKRKKIYLMLEDLFILFLFKYC